MKKTFLFILLTCFISPVSWAASYNQGHGNHADGLSFCRMNVFKVAVLPNEPIFDDIVKTDTIRSINAHHTAFNIFTGDSKNGHSLCTDEAIGENIVDYFSRLKAPTLYTLGDNEWTDCHRISNGEYDPLERLNYLRNLFFNKKTTQGRRPIPVERQGNIGEKYSENSRFIYGRIMFVALNVVGSNNNLVVTEKQCFKKSNRTWADCDKATEEYRERNQMNVQWLKESFQEARDQKLPGIAVAIQADIYFPFEMSDGGYQDDFLPQLDADNGFSDFFHTLVEETRSYNGQVVLIHGDSHYFKLDKAMFNDDGTITNNYTRVETFGDVEQSWVEMTVNPRGREIFSFKPVTLDAVAK